MDTAELEKQRSDESGLMQDGEDATMEKKQLWWKDQKEMSEMETKEIKVKVRGWKDQWSSTSLRQLS